MGLIDRIIDEAEKYKILDWHNIKDSDDYDNDGKRELVEDVSYAQVYSSELVKEEDGKFVHRPLLDIDIPAVLIPSSTPGHNHLIFDVKLSWEQYEYLLETLADVGIIEVGYFEAAKSRHATMLRLPWIKKGMALPTNKVEY